MARSDLKDPANGERRNIERRLEELEKDYQHLSQSLQRVEIEQQNAREVLKSRFEALSKGQDLLLVKIDSFDRTVTTMAGNPQESPAGRAIAADILRLQRELDEHGSKLAALDTFRNELGGGLKFAQWIGFISFLTGLGALWTALTGGL